MNHSPENEIVRLKLMQRLLRSMADGHLTPGEIRQHINKLETCRIADIGVGSATWPEAMLKEIPENLQIDGFDMDTSKFPAKETLSSNLKLYEHNALMPFNKEFIGQYDIVHVRFSRLRTEKR